LKTYPERIKTSQEPMEANIKPNSEEMNSKESEGNLGRIEDMAEHQDVPNEETMLEIIEPWRTNMGTGI
jgi:hypothetical protein